MKVKTQARLQVVCFLSQTPVPSEGCPQDLGPATDPLPRPPLARHPGGSGGPGVEVSGGAPLGYQDLFGRQPGFPSSSGEFAKGWRARVPRLVGELNCLIPLR